MGVPALENKAGVVGIMDKERGIERIEIEQQAIIANVTTLSVSGIGWGKGGGYGGRRWENDPLLACVGKPVSAKIA